MARLENLIWPQTPSQESALKSVLVRRCGRSLTTQAPGAGQQKVPWDGVAVHPANVARRDPEDLILRFPSVETRAKRTDPCPACTGEHQEQPHLQVNEEQDLEKTLCHCLYQGLCQLVLSPPALI